MQSRLPDKVIYSRASFLVKIAIVIIIFYAYLPDVGVICEYITL